MYIKELVEIISKKAQDKEITIEKKEIENFLLVNEGIMNEIMSFEDYDVFESAFRVPSIYKKEDNMKIVLDNMKKAHNPLVVFDKSVLNKKGSSYYAYSYGRLKDTVKDIDPELTEEEYRNLLNMDMSSLDRTMNFDLKETKQVAFRLPSIFEEKEDVKTVVKVCSKEEGVQQLSSMTAFIIFNLSRDDKYYNYAMDKLREVNKVDKKSLAKVKKI